MGRVDEDFKDRECAACFGTGFRFLKLKVNVTDAVTIGQLSKDEILGIIAGSLQRTEPEFAELLLRRLEVLCR